jgi:hypothetical protein
VRKRAHLTIGGCEPVLGQKQHGAVHRSARNAQICRELLGADSREIVDDGEHALD